MAHSYAVIGCGKPRSTDGATGFGMSHQHTVGFKTAGCKVVGLADIKIENAETFKAQHGDGSTQVFSDYHQMLAEIRPEVVSVCTWPGLHAEMTLAAIASGAKAVHCEKPMALNFGDAKQMHEAALAKGCQLTFNHQRRFNVPFVSARQLLRDGTIGTLQRMEVICGNLYDWGTHWFDMMHFLNEESAAEWVIGQIDLRDRKEIFGAPIEGQGLAYIKFKNDVRVSMMTGHQAPQTAQPQFTLHGTDGMLEIEPPNCGKNHLRYVNSKQTGWVNVPSDEGIHGDDAVLRACREVIECLQTGRESELSSRKALQSTTVIFATYESSRRRGRVDMPLDVNDSALADLIASL